MLAEDCSYPCTTFRPIRSSQGLPASGMSIFQMRVLTFAAILLYVLNPSSASSHGDPPPNKTPWKWNAECHSWKERYPSRATKRLPRDISIFPPDDGPASESDTEANDHADGISMLSLRSAMPMIDQPTAEEMQRWYGSESHESQGSSGNDNYSDGGSLGQGSTEAYDGGQDLSYDWYYQLPTSERSAAIQHILTQDHRMKQREAEHYVKLVCGVSNMELDSHEYIINRIYKAIARRKAKKRLEKGQ